MHRRLQQITDDPADHHQLTCQSRYVGRRESAGGGRSTGGRHRFAGIWSGDGPWWGSGNVREGQRKIRGGLCDRPCIPGSRLRDRSARRRAANDFLGISRARDSTQSACPPTAASWRVLEKAGFRPTGERGNRAGMERYRTGRHAVLLNPLMVDKNGDIRPGQYRQSAAIALGNSRGNDRQACLA